MGEVEKKRIKLTNVIAGAMNAFPVMEGNGPAYGIYRADYERLMAFLAQCKDDNALLVRAVRALELVAEAKDDLEIVRALNVARRFVADWNKDCWPPR